MNCNTTHYRANSSSVPGDPTVDYDVRQSSYLAAQQVVGLLSQRRDRSRALDSGDFVSLGVAIDSVGLFLRLCAYTVLSGGNLHNPLYW